MSQMIRQYCFAVVFAACLALGGAISPGWASPGQTYRVKADDTALRSGPTSNAAVVAWLKADQRVLEYEERADWLRVAVFGGQAREGWILRSAVEPESRQPPPQPLPRPLPVPVPEPEATPRTFILAITGSPALEFIGHCRVVANDGSERRTEIKNFIPKSYSFRGAALRCTVQKWDARGRLQVAIRGKDQKIIAQQETAARYNYVRVYSSGPWGAAGSIRGNIPTITLPKRVQPRPRPPVRPSNPPGIRAHQY